MPPHQPLVTLAANPPDTRETKPLPTTTPQTSQGAAAVLASLRDLLTYLRESCQLAHVGHVERRHLEGYLGSLDSRGLSGSYRRRIVAAIRSLFAFLEDRGHVRPDPARKLIPPERERHTPRFLTEGEYKRLLEAVRHEPRDAAIIELLLQTGMRLSEVAGMKVTDVDLPARISKEPGNAGSVTILGKGRRHRIVTLNWKVCKAIKSYLAVRPAGTDDPRLFLTKFRLGIGPRSIERAVGKYLTEAGIAGASVHSLRHTFGTHAVRRGTQLRVVQEVLGHSSLKTTSIYVSLAREDMDRQLQENAL
jgi:site-specific recombinase XerD